MGDRAESVVVRDRRGNRFRVSTADAVIGKELYIGGDYDGDVVDLVVGELTARGFKPALVVDVGANIGTVTVDLLARFPHARGIAIEPDETNFRLLEENIEANGLAGRVVALCEAAGAVDGEAELELSPDNFGDHRIRVASAAPGRYGEERRATRRVPVRRLDGLIERGVAQAGVPTLVWADVQGHEAQLLAGAQMFHDVPVVLELWPYGLRRAGGRELLGELTGAWAAVVDLRGGRRELRPADLAALLDEIEARPYAASTDVLLLPESLTGGGVNRRRAESSDGEREVAPG